MSANPITKDDPSVDGHEKPLPEMVTRTGAKRLLKDKFDIDLAEQTLANMHVKGLGPPVVYFGRKVLHPVPLLLAWARSRMSPVVHSSSEASVLQDA